MSNGQTKKMQLSLVVSGDTFDIIVVAKINEHFMKQSTDITHLTMLRLLDHHHQHHHHCHHHHHHHHLHHHHHHHHYHKDDKLPTLIFCISWKSSPSAVILRRSSFAEI